MVLPIIYVLLSGWMVWGSYVFSGVVTDGKLDQAVRFCYAFTIVALVTSVLPFCVPGLIPSTSAPVGLLYGCVSGTGTDATGARINSEVRCGEQHQSQWLSKIGGGAVDPTKTSQPQSGSLSPPTLEEWQIHGGMVVPLYVVVLALFGAAVSMTRRVPEYQRQAMNARNPVTNQQAREDLVLQIMQVVSAPVLATIAYYIFNPGDQMQTVLIGFASGFASEPILRNIRGLVEKLSPEPAGGPGAIRGPIAVRVTPPGVHLKPGNAIQFSSQVSGSENAEVIWKIERIANIDADKTGTISQSGYYSSPSARPTGVETVTVTAASAADRTKSGSATVTLET